MTVLCGQEALSPARVGEVCLAYPCDEVYALPWITSREGLVADMDSNRGKPRRLVPCEKNTDLASGEYMCFDEKLGGEAFGVMAWVVQCGQPILNEIMKCPFPSAFYGKVVVPFAAESFMVDCGKMDLFFPCAPLSAKLYAATTVAVTFRNTPMFSEATGTTTETVDIIEASSYIPGSTTFMNAYHMMTGKAFVGLSNPSRFQGRKMPRMRYNRGYRE